MPGEGSYFAGFGPWGNEALASMYGSAAELRGTDNLAFASNALYSEPVAFASWGDAKKLAEKALGGRATAAEKTDPSGDLGILPKGGLILLSVVLISVGFIVLVLPHKETIIKGIEGAAALA